uniref:Uncharacterized protein n=1 Tax=Siphoviridae sp. ctg0K17 TaxID=2825600 RepID=A0A8S5PVY8_9CAUD|nr:MAG TPA: hypothetical protein [Siphoviridae sp. ctg0K17]
MLRKTRKILSIKCKLLRENVNVLQKICKMS